MLFAFLLLFTSSSVFATTLCQDGFDQGPSLNGMCPIPGTIEVSDGSCCPTANVYEPTLAPQPVTSTTARMTDSQGSTVTVISSVGTTRNNNVSGTTRTSTSSCADKLNPETGVSDCPARADLCTDMQYLSLMKVECPKTCGFCTETTTSSSSTGSGSCVDHIHPVTGVSDCPVVKNLCNDPNYVSIMASQCPRTCGLCSGGVTVTRSPFTSSSPQIGRCLDRINPLRGTSDCPGRRSYCSHPLYITLMRIQCPATCGFC